MVHGEAVGLMLPHVVRFNAADTVACGYYAELARAAGLAGPEQSNEQAARALIERLEILLDTGNVPRSLSEAGVPLAEVPTLAAEAARQWTAQFNPRPVAETDFAALFQAAFSPSHNVR
jgi:alcohol dehydrogenase